MRSKTLFASTRATLVRDLGTEKFEGGTIFVTDAFEVTDPKEWDQRSGKGASREAVDEIMLTREERELGAVKRAEDEERFGTQRRDIGWGGGAGSGQGTGVGRGEEVGGQGTVTMTTTGEVKERLRDGLKESGSLVILVR